MQAAAGSGQSARAHRKLHRSLGLRALMIEGFLSREQGAWFGRLLAQTPRLPGLSKWGSTRATQLRLPGRTGRCHGRILRPWPSWIRDRAKQYIDKAFPGGTPW